MCRLMTLIAVAIIFSGCSEPDYQTSLRGFASQHKEAMASATKESGFDNKAYSDAIADLEFPDCPAELQEPWGVMQESSKLIAGYGHDDHVLKAGSSDNPIVRKHGLEYQAALKEAIDLLILHDAKPK